jgi:hypothetical protein
MWGIYQIVCGGCASWYVVLTPLASCYKLVVAGKRALKNIGGQVDGDVERYRTDLGQLRGNFLAYATLAIEATVSNTAPDMYELLDSME